MNIYPINMSVTEWTAQSTLELSRFGTIPTLMREEEWKEWARAVIELPGVARQHPPFPGQFEDWREWASRFNQTVRT